MSTKHSRSAYDATIRGVERSGGQESHHLGSNLRHRSATLIKSLFNFSVRLTAFISADLWAITFFFFIQYISDFLQAQKSYSRHPYLQNTANILQPIPTSLRLKKKKNFMLLLRVPSPCNCPLSNLQRRAMTLTVERFPHTQRVYQDHINTFWLYTSDKW